MTFLSGLADLFWPVFSLVLEPTDSWNDPFSKQVMVCARISSGDPWARIGMSRRGFFVVPQGGVCCGRSLQDERPWLRADRLRAERGLRPSDRKLTRSRAAFLWTLTRENDLT